MNKKLDNIQTLEVFWELEAVTYDSTVFLELCPPSTDWETIKCNCHGNLVTFTHTRVKISLIMELVISLSKKENYNLTRVRSEK